jgi:5-methyltetrahydropteroyltriglutamate--homocysteine methyltransferase
VGVELDYAAELINRIIEGIKGPRIGIHICRGNWSTREDVLLTGDYAPLLPALTKMKVQQFVLEYATPRAGDIKVVGEALSGNIPGTDIPRELGLGVVNPRTSEAETPEEIVNKTRLALAYFRPDQIFLNTDCGFGCFATRCVNVEEVATKKIKSIVQAAKMLRKEYS